MNTFKCSAVMLIVVLMLPAAASADAAKDAYEKGKACLEKKDYDSAVTAFDEAIRLDPKNALAYCNRGFAHCKKGHCEKTAREYGEAIPLNDKETEDQLWLDHQLYKRMPILGPIRPGTQPTCLVPPSDDQVGKGVSGERLAA